jgi:ribonuclease HII
MTDRLEGTSARRRPLVHHGTALVCDRHLEERAIACGHRLVAGIDEVGRGAVCGPVLAGAVILGLEFPTAGLDDSKRLTASQRKHLAELIRNEAEAWGLGAAEPEEIDQVGIVRATGLAMRRALAALPLPPDLVLVDGTRVAVIATEQWPIVKGDAQSVSIAAASIIAKVMRDSLMERLGARFADYGLSRNKGYGTADHLAALRRLGPIRPHRRTFIAGQLGLFSDREALSSA